MVNPVLNWRSWLEPMPFPTTLTMHSPDVVATLELAKRMKTSQPKLFNWMFAHRTNRQIYHFVQRNENQPMLFIDSVVGASQSYCTIVLCVAMDFYPGQNPQDHTPHTLYCIDLLKDVAPLFDLPIEELNRLLFSKSEALASSDVRPPIFRIKTNQSPSLLPLTPVTQRYTAPWVGYGYFESEHGDAR